MTGEYSKLPVHIRHRQQFIIRLGSTRNPTHEPYTSQSPDLSSQSAESAEPYGVAGTACAYLSRVADHLSGGVRLPAPRHLVGDLERRSGVRCLRLGLGHSRAAEAALACARTQHTARVGAPGTDEAAEVHRVINSAAGVCGWGVRLGCAAGVCG